MELDLVSLSEATSGAVGAVLSNTILYPLDICKAKYQAEVTTSQDRCKYRKLSDVAWEAISKGQVESLYQGLATKNLHSFLSQFVYFYGYTYLKRLYLSSSNHTIGTKANLLLAAAAGACTAFLTQPLDTASSRMQTSELGKSQGLWETLSAGSWREAYDGLSISLLLTSNPAIQYTVFDQLKQSLLKRKQRKGVVGDSQVISAFSAFVLGAISKSIATLLTYPAIRCKVMIQASDADKEEGVSAAAGVAKGERSGKGKGKGIADVLQVIWKNEGALGFFKGLRAQIFKTVLSSALLLMIKEKISTVTWILILATRRHLFASQRMLRNA